MTLTILVLIVLAAVILRRIGWRRTSRAMGFLAVLAFLAVACGLVPWFLLAGLQSGLSAKIPDMHGEGRTVIVVLGGGMVADNIDNELRVQPLVYGRLAKGVELYRACRTYSSECTMLVSGGNPQNFQLPEATVYGNELVSMGVDAKDLIREGRSLNTWQNAQFTAKILPPQTARVLLVTSGTHLARAQLYFGHFGIHAIPVRADFEHAPTIPTSSGTNFLLTDVAIHEYLGIARYYLYEAFGWNVTATGAGAL